MKRLLGLAAVVVAVLVAAWVAWRVSTAPDDLFEPPPTAERTAPPDVVDERGDAVATARSRRLVPPPSADAVPVEQAFLGRVVGPGGAPLAAAVVELVESTGDDLLAAALLVDRGFEVPPVGRVATGPDGRFRIGVRAPSHRGYELRVAHSQHPSRSLGPLLLTVGRDTDLGDVALAPGAILIGQITVDGRPGLPVADAEVEVRPSALVVARTPTTSRRRAATARTDAGGRYRLEGLPADTVTVTVRADGFATRVLPGVTLEAGAPNQRDLSLQPGRTIEGRVTAPGDRPLSSAEVTASTIGVTPPTESGAITDASGRYRIRGLVDGPHRVTARAPGHAERSVQPIASGRDDVDFELAALPALRVRVLQPDGGPATRYDLELRRIDPRDAAGERLLVTPGAPLERVVPDRVSADAVFEHPGVPPGRYAFEARAAGFAESFSPAFDVTADGPPAVVEFGLRRGADLTVSVRDSDGRPLANARVATMAADAPVWQPGATSPLPLAAGSVPRVSRRTVTTDPQGVARFTALAAGSYRVVARSEGLCDAVGPRLDLDDGTADATCTLALEPGCRVTGTVQVDGAPATQVRVSLVRVEPTPETGGTTVIGSAVSGPDGSWSLLEPLPPGRYEARAYRLTLSNPLERILDQKRSLQLVDLGRSQERHEVHFQLEGT